LAGTPPVFPYCLHYFSLFQVFHQRESSSDDCADFYTSSVGCRLWERFANNHFVSLPEKLKTVDLNSLSLMEAGDTTNQHLSASERQMQALTANIQELVRQSAADRREMQELAKQNQKLMAFLRSRGEIPSPGQGQKGEEVPRNEGGRDQNQNQN
jgi:hypothetical protein